MTATLPASPPTDPRGPVSGFLRLVMIEHSVFALPFAYLSALTAMAQAWGAERSAAVCRELTKTHEEVRRGPVAELAVWAADGVRGEVTIVVAGADPGAGLPTDDESLRAAVAELEATGTSRKDAIVEVARAAGVPKRQVYNLVHGGGPGR